MDLTNLGYGAKMWIAMVQHDVHRYETVISHAESLVSLLQI